MGVVAKILSVAPIGFDGRLIEVECDCTNGLPNLQIVGLANKSIEEARERVKSSITNSLLDYPAKRITINLAPAQIPKDGTHYDLPIALSVLVASGQLTKNQVSGAVFAGELALDGQLRPVANIITIVEAAKKAMIPTVYLPQKNIDQASLISGVSLVPVQNLKSLFLHLKGEKTLPKYESKPPMEQKNTPNATSGTDVLIDDIIGQENAKRALIIAAAGNHNILLSGSPGAGKTMLGKALAGILPHLSNDEQITVTKLQSIAGENIDKLITQRPFRSPHHTSSRTALIGGGTHPKPGEVSLAHSGVLFLDEIPEYPRSNLEALRQPIEDRQVSISRANGKVKYPANFILVATMNPCPCGYYGDKTKECTCSSMQIINYQNKLSGPLMDRIDMKVHVSPVPHSELLKNVTMNNIQQNNAQKNVSKARNFQASRYNSREKYNSDLSNTDLKRFAKLSDEPRQLLEQAAAKLELSARATFKVIKVARTIADLEQQESIAIAHISEALQYR